MFLIWGMAWGLVLSNPPHPDLMGLEENKTLGRV